MEWLIFKHAQPTYEVNLWNKIKGLQSKITMGLDTPVWNSVNGP